MATTELNQAEVEQRLSRLTEEYNSSRDKADALKVRFNELTATSFKLLQTYHNQYVNSDPAVHNALNPLKEEYQNSLKALDRVDHDFLTAEYDCHTKLKPLRSLQNTYLVGLVNGLQSENAQLKANIQTLEAASSTRRDNLQDVGATG